MEESDNGPNWRQILWRARENPEETEGSHSCDHDLNPELSGYGAGVLKAPLQCSAKLRYKD
jgi:hypothetical protein